MTHKGMSENECRRRRRCFRVGILDDLEFGGLEENCQKKYMTREEKRTSISGRDEGLWVMGISRRELEKRRERVQTSAAHGTAVRARARWRSEREAISATR